MVEENISQEFRMRKIEETRNYSLEEIKQNELMIRKHIQGYKLKTHVRLDFQKKLFLFTSINALEKCWKMLFISS